MLIAFPRPVTAALVALSYLCFFGIVAVARRRGGPLATCGCFGRPDTPPTALHLVIDLALAVTAGRRRPRRAAARHPRDRSWPTSPGPASRSCSSSAVGLWLTALALSALAALTAARRLVRPLPVRAS